MLTILDHQEFSRQIRSLCQHRTITIILSALLSATLVYCSFPPLDMGWLAWFALVPLMLPLVKLSPRTSFLTGLFFGMASLLSCFYWIFNVPGFRFYHAVFLCLYFSLYPALWCMISANILKKCPHFLWPIFAASLWVVLDYLKAHAGFLALPWNTLDLSQHRDILLLQLAAITGGYGITFIIVLVNAAITQMIRHRSFGPGRIAIVFVLLIHAWGLLVCRQPQDGQPVKVAVIQPSILLSERETAHGREAARNRLASLTSQAAARGAHLAVWPETAILQLPHQEKKIQWVQHLSQKTNMAILSGASVFEKFQRPPAPGRENGRHHPYQVFNSAFLVDRYGVVSAPYHKQRLVPFGEYLPLQPLIRWPQWLVKEPLPLTAGKAATFFSLSSHMQISPVICWENQFADLVRAMAGGGAGMLVQISNDNHFGRSAAAYQHNLASVMRAVENRTPVLISSNTGPSEIIDAQGRVVASTDEQFRPGLSFAEVVPRYHGQTFYTSYGDIFIWLCGLVVLLIGAAADRVMVTERLNIPVRFR